MTSNSAPLLLFYPTSPVHVRDMQLVARELCGWRILALTYEPLAKISPGIPDALDAAQIGSVRLGIGQAPDNCLPADVSVLLLGAVFEPFALELFAWAKLRGIPVAAIEEVAQLALNQNDISNYDAPFDRLFVASPEEYNRFVALGHPSERLRISGLLAYDRLNTTDSAESASLRARLGISSAAKPIIYTTSPLRSRLAIHNKDDHAFRQAAIAQIVQASRLAGEPVLVKLHPNEDLVAARVAIGKLAPDAIVVGREIPIDALLPLAGVVVNRGNSQTCLEAILREVPTVVAACGLHTLFHDVGGAYVVNAIDELGDAIVRALRSGAIDASTLRAKHFHRPPNGVAGFVAAELSQLVTEPSESDEASWNWLVKSVLFVGGHSETLRLLRKLEHPTEWQKLVSAALQAHIEGRADDAIVSWLRCIALDPDWFFPHYELAHGYMAKAEHELSKAHARKAIEAHPPFHSLWHEIPMRLILMATHRATGDHGLAAAEMSALDARSLTEVVPELQYEKALQLRAAGQLVSALNCLERTLILLGSIPVNRQIDADIEVRALGQLDAVTNGFAETRAHYWLEQCYRLTSDHRPSETWPIFALARAQLAQGKLAEAAGTLHRITRAPERCREVIEQTLAPGDNLMLGPHWADLPYKRLAPLKLALLTLFGALRALRRTGMAEWETPATSVFLISLLCMGQIFNRR